MQQCSCAVFEDFDIDGSLLGAQRVSLAVLAIATVLVFALALAQICQMKETGGWSGGSMTVKTWKKFGVAYTLCFILTLVSFCWFAPIGGVAMPTNLTWNMGPMISAAINIMLAAIFTMQASRKEAGGDKSVAVDPAA